MTPLLFILALFSGHLWAEMPYGDGRQVPLSILPLTVDGQRQLCLAFNVSPPRPPFVGPPRPIRASVEVITTPPRKLGPNERINP